MLGRCVTGNRITAFYLGWWGGKEGSVFICKVKKSVSQDFLTLKDKGRTSRTLALSRDVSAVQVAVFGNARSCIY